MSVVDRPVPLEAQLVAVYMYYTERHAGAQAAITVAPSGAYFSSLCGFEMRVSPQKVDPEPDRNVPLMASNAVSLPPPSMTPEIATVSISPAV